MNALSIPFWATLLNTLTNFKAIWNTFECACPVPHLVLGVWYIEYYRHRMKTNLIQHRHRNIIQKLTKTTKLIDKSHKVFWRGDKITVGKVKGINPLFTIFTKIKVIRACPVFIVSLQEWFCKKTYELFHDMETLCALLAIVRIIHRSSVGSCRSTSNVELRRHVRKSWWRHQMKTFSALLAFCAGNSPVPGELPAQRPVTRSFDVSFDLRLNKRLSKQSWGWWSETPSRSLWRHRNVVID